MAKVSSLMLWGAVLSSAASCGEAPTAVRFTDGGGSRAALSQSCDLSGTWGIKLTVPVRWDATVAIEGGQGTVTQWARAIRQRTPQGYTDTFAVCGTEVPDNQARPAFHREKYGIIFPDALFDAGTLPSAAVNLRVDGANPGAKFTMDGLVITLGLKLAEAATAPWPKRARDLRTVDTDRDGRPGITILASQAPGYAPPPLNYFMSKRAAKFYIALRNVISDAHGTLHSCDKLIGTAHIPVIAGKAALNSHIMGCLRTDGQQCTLSEAQLLDQLQSGFGLTGEPTLEMQRLPDGATCKQVRAQK